MGADRCFYCSGAGPLDFGRDCEFCSDECYCRAALGRAALAEWEEADVVNWIAEAGCGCWARHFGNLDGSALMVTTNERILRKLGMTPPRAQKLMRMIEELRCGAWGQPEPPLKDLPLATVAVRGLRSNPNWRNALEDPERRSYAALCPRAIDEATAWRWFQTLYTQLAWQDLCDTKYQDEGKKIPRRTVFVVGDGCNCVYGYSGVKVAPIAEPDFVGEIRRACAALAGYSEDELPNSCNINLYRDGQDSVGWHTDNEPLFEAESVDACILSLSLGASRKFTVKHQDKTCGQGKPMVFNLHHGDLCTMEGKFQRYYLHGVPKEPRVLEPRINLTWRWITRHNKGSGCKLHGEGN